ncbi:hypothetical protein CMI37_38610 [Candidatus Pacearchaeota archaeon]|nr:hypothetical protein [Candidatus Pacearchaeota archaeon]|tara:strand:- start:654 stop:1016 length:363 start_codon:yes stop_codon:yes gene_type:complete
MEDGEQLELDLSAGIELRDMGMALAAGNNRMALEIARGAAEKICREKGVVTSDDVRQRLGLNPSDIRDSQNWMGSIFRVPQFIWTGERVKSRIPRNHAAEIKVWTLKDSNWDSNWKGLLQ